MFRGSTEIKAGSHFKGGSRISSLVTEIGYFDSDIAFRSRRSRFVVTFAKEQILSFFFFLFFSFHFSVAFNPIVSLAGKIIRKVFEYDSSLSLSLSLKRYLEFSFTSI